MLCKKHWETLNQHTVKFRIRRWSLTIAACPESLSFNGVVRYYLHCDIKHPDNQMSHQLKMRPLIPATLLKPRVKPAWTLLTPKMNHFPVLEGDFSWPDLCVWVMGYNRKVFRILTSAWMKRLAFKKNRLIFARSQTIPWLLLHLNDFL